MSIQSPHCACSSNKYHTILLWFCERGVSLSMKKIAKPGQRGSRVESQVPGLMLTHSRFMMLSQLLCELQTHLDKLCQSPHALLPTGPGQAATTCTSFANILVKACLKGHGLSPSPHSGCSDWDTDGCTCLPARHLPPISYFLSSALTVHNRDWKSRREELLY